MTPPVGQVPTPEYEGGHLPLLCVHPRTHTLEAGMAHITDLVAPHFTGHVGPVRFVNGHAETDDPELVAFFDADPDRYAVTETDEPPADEHTDSPVVLECADCGPVTAEQTEAHDAFHADQDDDPQE